MTDANSIEKFLLEYFGDEIADKGLSTKIADLDIDSLGLVELVMDVEEKFSLELDVEAFENHTTLSDLCVIALKKLG